LGETLVLVDSLFGVVEVRMDISDVFSDSLSFDNSWCFPQPMSVCKRLSSGLVFSSRAELNPERLCWFKRGDNHLQVYRAQCLLNRYITGHFGPEWLGSDGFRLPLLLEDGRLDVDTELALKRFQQDWSLPPSGCLCPKTRALLPPVLHFHATLQRNRVKIPPLRWSKYNTSYGSGTGWGGSNSSSSTKKADDDGSQPSGTGGVVTPPPAKKDDDDDKPFTLNLGFGGSGPVWTGKSSTGKRVPSEKPEVDQKMEFDLNIPTGLALRSGGRGQLKLTLSGEYDVPLDNDHRGKPSIQGTAQISADDLFKNNRLSLTPFVEASRVFQRDTDKWKQATEVKAGVDLDVKLTKGIKVEAEVNSGVHIAGPGNDKDTTAKVVVPVEGFVILKVDVP
jgi:hypothetical protein